MVPVPCHPGRQDPDPSHRGPGDGAGDCVREAAPGARCACFVHALGVFLPGDGFDAAHVRSLVARPTVGGVAVSPQSCAVGAGDLGCQGVASCCSRLKQLPQRGGGGPSCLLVLLPHSRTSAQSASTMPPTSTHRLTFPHHHTTTIITCTQLHTRPPSTHPSAQDIAERYVLLMDPILGTGNSAAHAIRVRRQG